MTEVHAIFEAFGGPSKLAQLTGLSLQTVSDWRAKGRPEIPPWRRPLVLAAAESLEKPLPESAIAYLQSDERPARASKAA
jgi:DNA-binding transcriptional regulator YdaS (Cro superfamily)